MIDIRRIDREPAEVGIADTREVRRSYARTSLRAVQAQVLLVERLDDLGGQDGLKLFNICVLTPEVAENIAAAARDRLGPTPALNTPS